MRDRRTRRAAFSTAKITASDKTKNRSHDAERVDGWTIAGYVFARQLATVPTAHGLSNMYLCLYIRYMDSFAC